ncbi:hypothetical protein LCG56_02025 [Pseudomonas cannabina pv. alisalensis]|nr:AAA family ATPase [Pseudomonas syringae group genomosp. 3]UBY97961.1 hypothetical protein LCG56_02025 [Pseudomonas cannabina pv. alisalensis]
MYLLTLDVQRFKFFGEPFSIKLHDGLNALVGENGAGQTGVVSAIRQLFNDSESGKRVITERDFYRGFGKNDVAAEELKIQATFSGLDESDVIAFDTWCGNHAEAKLTFTALNQESRGRRMTHAHHRSLALQVKNKVMNALLNSGFIVATEVDEIDAQGR